MRVGFIGVGNIGRPMAERLAAPPFELTVFDVTPAALDPFKGKARIAASPAALGLDADLIGICVRHDADVRAVMDGEEGLLRTLRPGAVVAIHSTIRPATVSGLAGPVAKTGAYLLDAAVSGGPVIAAAGKLVCMVGGDAAPLARIRPMLEAHSSRITHVGKLGCGMAAKLCNNLVTYMQLLATVESFRLAAAAGVEDSVLRDIMTANGNLTTTMGQYLDFTRDGPAKLGRDGYAALTNGTCGLAEKDLDFALACGADMGVALPGTEAVRRLIRAALESR